MSDANVIPLHPLDNAEALAWLRAQPNGRIETSVSDLARQLGWPRTKLRRRLATWAEAGHITRRDGRKGKIVISVAPSRAPDDRLPIIVPASDGPAGGAPVVLPSGPTIAASVSSSRARGRGVLAIGTAAVLLATALGLAAVGLTMNARFAASFGQTADAAVLLAAIGLAIDVLAAVLPTVAAQLWHHGSRAAAATAWTIWLVALIMTLLAASGFASTNIGDAVAGRAKIAGENASLAERIAQLRDERAGITETRAVGAIEAELQQAQPGAQPVWKATDGCRDVTRVSSGRVCAAVLSLREDVAAAQRRDAIDAEMREAQAKLAALPAIVTADPQVITTAEIVAWISAGHLSPRPRDIYWLRTLGLTITPSLAGLIAMLALALAQARRTEEVAAIT